MKEEENKIRNQIIKDYENIVEMIPINQTKIDIKPSAGFNIEGLIKDLNTEYKINCDYIIFEFNQIRIYIE